MRKIMGSRQVLVAGGRGYWRGAKGGAVPAMKVTISAAMRARDVSRPGPEHLAVAEAAEASAPKGTWANEARESSGTEPGEARANEHGEVRASEPCEVRASEPGEARDTQTGQDSAGMRRMSRKSSRRGRSDR
jgi:hypothetical protein